MAEEEPQPEAAPAAAAGSSKLRKLLIVIPVVLVIVAALGGAAWFGYQKMMAQKAKPEEVVKEIGPTFAIKDIVANLGDESGDRFCKLSLELEMSDPTLQPEIEKRLPQIKQIINLTLRSKTATELNTPKGLGLLSEELTHQINATLTGEMTVRNTWITEIAVQ